MSCPCAESLGFWHLSDLHRVRRGMESMLGSLADLVGGCLRSKSVRGLGRVRTLHHRRRSAPLYSACCPQSAQSHQLLLLPTPSLISALLHCSVIHIQGHAPKWWMSLAGQLWPIDQWQRVMLQYGRARALKMRCTQQQCPSGV
jgi:hypothetical protein